MDATTLADRLELVGGARAWLAVETANDPRQS